MNLDSISGGSKNEVPHMTISFSLLDLESGMRDYTTEYLIDDLKVTEDDNIRISFNIKKEEEGTVNRFYFFMRFSSAREFTSLVDKIFFGRQSIKLEKNPWVTFLFQDSTKTEIDPGTIYLCKLMGGLPDKENVDFLLRWIYYAIDEDTAKEEITSIMGSKEMETLEQTINNLKKMGYANELLKKEDNSPVTAMLRRIGLGERFNPEKIAMEGLGYKKHGNYMLQEVKKDYVIVLSTKIGDAKVLAEKIGPLTRR